MRKFPLFLNPIHKDKFSDFHYARMKCYLRRNLYEHIISREESDYFSLDEFNAKFSSPNSLSKNMTLVKKAVNEIISELTNLGWKCKLSYGGTALFIYSENPPPNCFDSEETLS